MKDVSSVQTSFLSDSNLFFLRQLCQLHPKYITQMLLRAFEDVLELAAGVGRHD